MTETETVRRRAQEALARLNEESECLDQATTTSTKEDLHYWLGRCSPRHARRIDTLEKTTTTTARCRFFQRNGYCVSTAFCSVEECHEMKTEMARLVQSEWNPPTGKTSNGTSDQVLDSFGTNDEQNTQRGDYFLESADRVHYFAEPGALAEQEDGSSSILKSEFHKDKLAALNKAGHGLHLKTDGQKENAFCRYTFSDKIRELVLELGWKDPVIPQSMYIFKQARIGGAVNSHQDSTFLFTEPYQSCLGLWLALDDATLENGCLWVRPKSHTTDVGGVRRQYKRNPKHFGSEAIEQRSNQAKGDISEPKFVMEELVPPKDGGNGVGHEVLWDGSLPGGDKEVDIAERYNALEKAGFVPVECKAGDLLAFCGELDHLSLANFSDQPRHTFQLHLVEGPAESVVWSKSNWLQYEDGRQFQSLLRS